MRRCDLRERHFTATRICVLSTQQRALYCTKGRPVDAVHGLVHLESLGLHFGAKINGRVVVQPASRAHRRARMPRASSQNRHLRSLWCPHDVAGLTNSHAVFAFSAHGAQLLQDQFEETQLRVGVVFTLHHLGELPALILDVILQTPQPPAARNSGVTQGYARRAGLHTVCSALRRARRAITSTRPPPRSRLA